MVMVVHYGGSPGSTPPSPLLSQRALAPHGLREQGSAVHPVYGSPSYPEGQEHTCRRRRVGRCGGGDGRCCGCGAHRSVAGGAAVCVGAAGGGEAGVAIGGGLDLLPRGCGAGEGGLAGRGAPSGGETVRAALDGVTPGGVVVPGLAPDQHRVKQVSGTTNSSCFIQGKL